MFEISWSEIMVIAVVALVVVGPKELPGLLRQLGKMIGQFKRMAGDFQNQFNEAVKEAELDDLKKEVEELRKTASNTFKFDEGRIPENAPALKGPLDEVLELPLADEPVLEVEKAKTPSRKRKTVVNVDAAGVEPDVIKARTAKNATKTATTRAVSKKTTNTDSATGAKKTVLKKATASRPRKAAAPKIAVDQDV